MRSYTPEPILIRCKDPDGLAAQAAALVVQSAQESVRERGRFLLVLAGGATPVKTYRLLAEPDHAAAIDWPKTYLFFGDERLVPADDPRSNFGMARRTLLAYVPIAAGQVFPVPAERHTAAEAAAAYAGELGRFFAPAAASVPPRFDLVLLGLGDDGHTASLFPHAPALRVEDAWVTWSPPGTLPPLVDRVTMTYPILNAARHVAFLVAGERKAAVLRDVIEGGASREDRPAAGIQPAQGSLTWLVDDQAARLLTPGTNPQSGTDPRSVAEVCSQ